MTSRDYPEEVLQVISLFKRLVREEEGQGLVEYALIIGLVAIVLIGVLSTMEGGIAGVFDRIHTQLDSIVTPPAGG